MSPMSECVLAIESVRCRARSRKDHPVFYQSRVISANRPTPAAKPGLAASVIGLAPTEGLVPRENPAVGAAYGRAARLQGFGVVFCFTSYAPALGKNGAIFSTIGVRNFGSLRL